MIWPPLCYGAGMGTRTPTPEAREPKSRMSTNSITPAYEIYLQIIPHFQWLCQSLSYNPTKEVALRFGVCYDRTNE